MFDDIAHANPVQFCWWNFNGVEYLVTVHLLNENKRWNKTYARKISQNLMLVAMSFSSLGCWPGEI